MAAGDLSIYNDFVLDLMNGVFNLETDTIKLGLVTSAYTPSASATNPGFNAAATTNLKANECSAQSGNYAAGGASAANPTVSAVSGTQHKFDADNVTWTAAASSPQDARYGILYDDTDATSPDGGICWIDLGSDIDMVNGDLNVNWNASGILTVG